MGKIIQLRLEPDVAEMVAVVAKRNSRSIPGEVNHVLREYYTTPICPVTGVGPGEPMPPFHTVLDPTPRTNPAWTEAPLNLSFGAPKKSYRKMAAFAKKTTKLHGASAKEKRRTNARG